MMQAVIIHGPQGCGKTRHAKDFCELYGCTAWTDDWLPGDPLVPGLLHLTFEVPSGLSDLDVQIISFDEAMKALGEKIVVRHLGTTTWQGPANQAPEFLGAQPGHNIAPVVSPAQRPRLRTRWKVVATSNFADETYAEKEIIGPWLSEMGADAICEILNRECVENDRTFYTPKTAYYKLWRGMEELI